jgi:hypothetical protein
MTFNFSVPVGLHRSSSTYTDVLSRLDHETIEVGDARLIDTPTPPPQQHIHFPPADSTPHILHSLHLEDGILARI